MYIFLMSKRKVQDCDDYSKLRGTVYVCPEYIQFNTDHLAKPHYFTIFYLKVWSGKNLLSASTVVLCLYSVDIQINKFKKTIGSG